MVRKNVPGSNPGVGSNFPQIGQTVKRERARAASAVLYPLRDGPVPRMPRANACATMTTAMTTRSQPTMSKVVGGLERAAVTLKTTIPAAATTRARTISKTRFSTCIFCVRRADFQLR